MPHFFVTSSSAVADNCSFDGGIKIEEGGKMSIRDSTVGNSFTSILVSASELYALRLEATSSEGVRIEKGGIARLVSFTGKAVKTVDSPLGEEVGFIYKS